ERRTEASTLVALADLTRREGRADEAMRLAEEALSLARTTGRPELEWIARRTVSSAAVQNGNVARAIDELRASLRIINDLRANVAGDMSKVAFVDHRQDVFQELAVLLIGAGRSEEALETAEA